MSKFVQLILANKTFIKRKEKKYVGTRSLLVILCSAQNSWKFSSQRKMLRMSVYGWARTSEMVRQSCYVLCSMLVRCIIFVYNQGDAKIHSIVVHE